MKKIILAAFIMGMWATNALAQESITVVPDNDTQSIGNSVFAFIGILAPCEQQLANQMKQSGQTDAQIRQSVEMQCTCQNKGPLQEQLRNYDSIMARHPDWRGKVIVVKTPGGQNTTNPTIWENVRQQLAQCR